MKGRRPESAFGAFTEHFPPRTGFVVREITVSAGGFRVLAPAVLPQSTGQGALRRRATEAQLPSAQRRPGAAPKHSHPTSHLFPKRCFEGGSGRRHDRVGGGRLRWKWCSGLLRCSDLAA